MTSSAARCRRWTTAVIDCALRSCDCRAETTSSADYGFGGPCGLRAGDTRTGRRTTDGWVASYGPQRVGDEVGTALALHMVTVRMCCSSAGSLGATVGEGVSAWETPA